MLRGWVKLHIRYLLPNLAAKSNDNLHENRVELFEQEEFSPISATRRRPTVERPRDVPQGGGAPAPTAAPVPAVPGGGGSGGCGRGRGGPETPPHLRGAATAVCTRQSGDNFCS